jgi:putative ABC transport system substrate-binding protein
MRRREVMVGLAAAAAWPLGALAQVTARTARVGILSGAALNTPATAPLHGAFVDQLRSKGWQEGQNLIIERRHTEGRAELFAARAAELLALSPDVIVASNSQAVAAAKAQTASIPIVMIDVSHPVEAGFIKSLAQPGSNVTGVTNQGKDIAMKHYELLREIRPSIQRIALVFTPSNAGSKLGLEEQTVVARALGIDVIPVPFEGPADIGEATAILKRERAQALQVHTTPVTIVHRAMIAKLAMEHDLPTISFNEAMARAGILMTYGANRAESWRRAADYVDRLLRGEQASVLPVEQPTRFDLHINLKTAAALRLALPPTLLARADEVIE